MYFLALAAMGCTGEGQNNDSDTSVGVDPDDTSEASNYVTVDITVHAAIDGVPIDPVGVCIHEATEDVGNEDILAQAEVTGKAISVTVFNGGETVRPWIGAATSAKSSDGYRVLEFDGRQWVHPLADFLVSNEGCESIGETAKMIAPEYCEPTVALNGYLPKAEYYCVANTYVYDANKPDLKGTYVYTKEGDHVLEVTSGKDIVDVDENGLDGILADGCSLESSGAGLSLTCTDDVQQWVVSSAWNGDGFSVSITEGDFLTEYTCTK